jgi:rod shape determining protein RodA
MALDRRIIYHFDWTVFTLALGLAGVGLVSVLSATWGGARHGLDPLLVRQLLWIGVGTAMMSAAALFDYRALGTYAYAAYGVVVALLGVVAVMGQSTGGSRRWINLGLLKLEPSEVAKLAVVLARGAAARRLEGPRDDRSRAAARGTRRARAQAA